MRDLLLPGMTGLVLGLLTHWAGFTRPAALRQVLGLRRSHALRTALYFIGAGMALTALLCWLAVIDVDGIAVLPLTAGALAGGAVFGAAAALGGYTPLTAFAGAGGGRFPEALCTLAGCAAGAALLPVLAGPFAALQALPPQSAATVFRVTLDEPWLMGGGFAGQACAGALLMAIAACIPSNRGWAAAVAAAAEEEPIPEAEEGLSEPPRLPEPPEPPRLPPPAETLEDTFVALLPGEEPLVVDTAEEEGLAAEDAALMEEDESAALQEDEAEAGDSPEENDDDDAPEEDENAAPLPD